MKEVDITTCNMLTFCEIMDGDTFWWNGVGWKKLNHETAIADGWECSNWFDKLTTVEKEQP